VLFYFPFWQILSLKSRKKNNKVRKRKAFATLKALVMKKNTIRITLAIIFTAIFVGFFGWNGKTKYKTLEIDGKEYKLEIADTSAKRTKGLMEREKLAENEGMLFIFPQEARHSFWMYKTLIPLKMVWLDSNWEIVHVEENVPPCAEENPLKCLSYTSNKPAKYVIEINP
jgi:uncharacterized membrane protein (UPF0127 family)